MTKKGVIWFGVLVFLLTLIPLISGWEPSKTKAVAETSKEFPLIPWLILAGGFLLFRAGREFYAAWTSGKSEIKWVSFDMLAVALGLLTILILALESFIPGWWNHVWDSQGKLMILGLVVISLLWYILPGTGAATIKIGKSLTTAAGLIILLILIGKAVSPEIPKSLTEPAPQAANETVAPAPYQAPAEAIAAPAPHWETVVERKYVELNKFNDIDGGFVKIAEVSSENEKYLVEIESSDFQQYFIKDGKDYWQTIGPAGITNLHFTYTDKLPLRGKPDNRVGARIIKIGDSQPEYLGRRKEFSLNQAGAVEIKISTNMLQNVTEGNYPVANNFVKNKGGDWVTVKKWVTS